MLNFTTLVDHAEDEKKVLDVIHRVNSDLHDVALTAVIKDIRFFTYVLSGLKREGACINYSYYASDSDASTTLQLNTCRAVTPLPVVILVLKTALHLAPIRLIAQGDGLPFQIRCLMIYRPTPAEENDPEYPAL